VSEGTSPLADGMPEPWATGWGKDRHGLFTEFRVGAVTQRLRWIPAGRFWMGSPETEDGRYDNEGPRHEVELTSGYWLGETPVTQALWSAVMGTDPSDFKGAERPVEHVSWHDCVGFLEALNTKVPGLASRMPTEAEWEGACRGGTDGATWLGANDAATLNGIAWWDGNSGGETHPVRLKAPNPYGLYDMLGNVWEWCMDGERTYENELVRDPYGSLDTPYRVYRGGSWYWDARHVRAAYRSAGSPESRYDDLGFRLARGQVLRSSSSKQRLRPRRR
jgi:formylglycine-generating enzyme